MPTKTTILHTRSRHHEWQGVGPLSLKTFRRGEAHYSAAGGRYLVNDTCYLILNAGQEYAITVDAPTPVESFCLFFAPGLAEAVHYSLTATHAQLLDEPTPPAVSPYAFYERTYPYDTALIACLQPLRMASTQQTVDASWLEEQVYALMQALLVQQQATQAEVAALPYVRPATRAELYRRVYQAREYMLASLDQALTVDELAAQACLSPNHFLRTFKQIFQQTPHQYLTQQRLARAAYLLQTTALTVTEIGLQVGFDSLGSFSWRFRRSFGQSPAQYRHAKK